MKIIKIGADWCPECAIMRPRWAEIEKEMPKLQTEYIDIDKQPGIKASRHIDHVPTFIFLDCNDKEILRLKGLIEKEDLMKHIDENKNK